MKLRDLTRPATGESPIGMSMWLDQAARPKCYLTEIQVEIAVHAAQPARQLHVLAIQ